MATVAPSSLKRLSQSACSCLSCLIDATVGGRGLFGEPLSCGGGGGGVSAISTDPVDGRALALPFPFVDLFEAGSEPDGASFDPAPSPTTGVAAASAFALPALLVLAFRPPPPAADFVVADAALVAAVSSATSGKAALSARGVFRGTAEGAETMPGPVEDRRRELPAGRTHLSFHPLISLRESLLLRRNIVTHPASKCSNRVFESISSSANTSGIGLVGDCG